MGRPNAGKSTLLNQVLKHPLAIVSPKAQTTRVPILGLWTEGGSQAVLWDTPGLHRARPGGLNEWMMRRAEEILREADVIWEVVDPSTSPSREEEVCQHLVKAGAWRRSAGLPPALLCVLLNKADLPSTVWEAEKWVEGHRAALSPAFQSIQGFVISALHRTGDWSFLKKTQEALPEGPWGYPDPDQVSTQSLRFWVSEKIREQLYACLGEELPYACAVEIRTWQEPPKASGFRIEAVIYVERGSQKGMVIGEGAKKIKEIGQKVRQAIQPVLLPEGGKTPFFLGLQVEVLKNWSREVTLLKRLGYG